MGKTCSHIKVCKYVTEEECQLMEMCKHYKMSPFSDVPPKKERPALTLGNKGSVGRQRKDYSHLSIENDGDVIVARKVLKSRYLNKKLTETQETLFNSLSGKHIRTMNDIDRQQIIGLLNDVESGN